MLASFLIGLREGMEAALVVGILVAYLVRTGRRSHLPYVWAGVGAAVALSATVGAILTYGPAGMGERAEETLAGILSILAVGLVTWMVFWMARAARHLKRGLEERLGGALATGRVAVVAVAFLAVAREGVETALFLWAGASATEGTSPALGAGLGLAAAVVLGWAVYRGAVRLDLRAFFTWTGFALIVIAAGVLAYGVHELQEVGLVPGEDATAYDVSGFIAPDSTLGVVLRGLVSYSATPSWATVVVWWLYLGVVATLYARAVWHRAPAAPAVVDPAASDAHAAHAASAAPASAAVTA